MSTLRNVPALGTEATRVLDARATGAVTVVFAVVAAPWALIEPSLLNLGAITTGFLLGLLLLLKPPRLPGSLLVGITALMGVTAAYLTLVADAMSLAAALSLCVMLQVSALRHRVQAWVQLGLLVVVWSVALLVASVSSAVWRSMVPSVAALVLLTAITTWTRRYVDDLLVQLHHRADHDSLTGLLNRQGLTRRLRQPQWERSAVVGGGTRSTTVDTAAGGPRPAPCTAAAGSAGGSLVRGSTGVLVIDVDHFKMVNDQHGHLAGDEALMWLAALLRGALPTPVLLARFGGEEFLAVVPGVDLDTLVQRAERVRALVATTSTSRSVALTVSIGAAAGSTAATGSTGAPGLAGSTFEELVACADRGVYAAKTAGRNRVSVGTRLGEPLPTARR